MTTRNRTVAGLLALALGLVALVGGAGSASAEDPAYVNCTNTRTPAGGAQVVPCRDDYVQAAAQEAVSLGVDRATQHYVAQWEAYYAPGGVVYQGPISIGDVVQPGALVPGGWSWTWTDVILVKPFDPAALTTYNGHNSLGTFAVTLPYVTAPFVPATGDAAPIAVPDQGTVPVGERLARIAVLNNDVLPNGATALEVLAQPANGAATSITTSADWFIDYTATVGFVGQDSFTYRVTDKLGKSSQTNVVVDVLGAASVAATPVVVPAPVAVRAPAVKAPKAFAMATGVESGDSPGAPILGGLFVLAAGALLGLVILVRARRRKRAI